MEQSVALYFGSFNPVHNGHLEIAGFVLEKKLCHEVWFVISPQNPLKAQSELAPEQNRLAMLKIALQGKKQMKICDIEFTLPKPSYTINTLNSLLEIHPKINFSIIIGMDNLQAFRQWKSWNEILKRYQLLVYPRKNYSESEIVHENIIVMNDAPLFEVSSSMLRSMVKDRNIQLKEYLPTEVINYIKLYKLYSH
jgi:nicotinate-nucleotide adenylyltransferase